VAATLVTFLEDPSMKPIIAERASCKASLKGEINLKNAKGEFKKGFKGEFRAFAKKFFTAIPEASGDEKVYSTFTSTS
jgi:hypothetical protein